MLSILSRTPFTLLAALALIAAGCSGDSKTEESKTDQGKGKGKNEPVYPVAGVVTYQGKPLVNATVQFYPEVDLPYGIDTDAEGKYRLARLPVGDYKVVVQTKPDSPVGVGKAKDVAPPKDGGAGTKGISLPAEYQSKDKTPLTKKIEAGENTFDIAIK